MDTNWVDKISKLLSEEKKTHNRDLYTWLKSISRQEKSLETRLTCIEKFIPVLQSLR